MKIELLFLGISLVSGFTAGPSRSLSRKHARFNSRLPASTASSSATPLSSSKGVIESDTNLGSVEATNTIQVINNHTSKNNSCMKHKTYMDQQKGQNRIRSSNRKQKKQTRKNPTSDTDFLMKRTLQITSKHERFASYTESSILRSVHWILDAWNRMDTTTNKIEYNVKLASVQSLFDSLEELYHVKPTTKTWTRLIKAYGQEKGGHHAMDILHQMPTSERNVHCYAEVLDCFAHEIMMVQSEARYNQNGAIDTFPSSSSSSSSSSNHTKSLAKVAQDILQQMIDNDNLPTPNARCFHAVIRAWGHEYNPPAAQACMSLMQTLYSQGKIDEPPNRYCYNAVIYAWANSGHEWNAEMAEALLNQMSKDVHPNIVSYNLCIAAWAKTGNGERAESILRTMDSNESDCHPNHCKPNTMTYNSVMNAYAKSSDANAAEKAEKLLFEMKKRVEEEGDDCSVRPDFFSFSTVINAWARSLNSDKVDKVMNILNEMEKDYNIRPNVVIFNSILNACAYTFGDVALQRNAMETATSLLRKLDESKYDSPDHITYGTFLKVCLNQMIPGDMQSQIVKIIFLKCAKDGMVSQFVLDQMRSFSNSKMVQELLGFNHTDKTKGLMELPDSWRRNVVEGKRRRRGRS